MMTTDGSPSGKRLARAVVAVSGAIYRPRRLEFEGELDVIQTLPGESGLSYALGTVVGASVERATTIGQPLRVREISKAFPDVQALNKVSFDVEPSSITALVGGNGAGKTTLLRAITGDQQADDGSIRLGETAVRPKRRNGGISMVVPEQLLLFDHLSITDNLSLTPGGRNGWLIKASAEDQRARNALEAVGSDLDPATIVGRLSMPDKVVVGIARAIQFRCQVLIIDEPTEALSADGAGKIYNALRSLRDRGMSIVIVSHRIDDVFEFADRVAVLRDGELVHDTPVADTRPELIVHEIIGDDPDPASNP
jgi:ribose transport system ATP-binding protein